MIMTLSQNEFLASLTNLIIAVRVNKTVSDNYPELVRSCLWEEVPFGSKQALITVDTLETQDYSSNSTLLSTKLPIIDEQQLNTTDKKVIQVTLNRYLMTGAFANEGSLVEAMNVILSMLEKTRNIYLFKKIVAAYENWTGGTANDGTPIAAQASQTLTIDLIDTTNLTGEDLKSAETHNSNKIYKEILQLYKALTSPSRAYNELKFEEMSDGYDLKLILNSKFDSDMVVDSLSTLLNSQKITDRETWFETLVIDKNQFSKENTKTNVIGWFGDRQKYQIRPRFNVATSFFDGSNLNQNNWLHFWFISGFANGLPLVKLVANFTTPTPTTAAVSNK